MRLKRPTLSLFVASLAVAFAAGCSSDSTGPSTLPTGTYTLNSFTVVGVGQIPNVAGTITFFSNPNTFTLSLTGLSAFNPLIPEPLNDTGTYTTNGNEITLQSNSGLFSGNGTWAISGNQLQLNFSSQGVSVQTVWTKT